MRGLCLAKFTEIIYGKLRSTSTCVNSLYKMVDEHAENCEKTVLVFITDATRPVSFTGSKMELLVAIKNRFDDILSSEVDLLLKVSNFINI